MIALSTRRPIFLSRTQRRITSLKRIVIAAAVVGGFFVAEWLAVNLIWDAL